MRNKSTHAATALCAAIVASTAPLVSALEIDPNVAPEIHLAGQALVTTNGSSTRDDNGNNSVASSLDSADSSVSLGFSKYLFNSTDYGYARIGVKTVEDHSDLPDNLYVHQMQIGIGGPRYELQLGRGRLPNTLLALPTLRDSDLLDFTTVANGMSAASAEEYQVFGNSLAARTWLKPALSVQAALTARTETNAAGQVASSGSFNGGALTLAYEIPEAMMVGQGVRFASVGLDQQRVVELGNGTANEAMTAWLAGLNYQLNSNPEGSWLLDAQLIANQGAQIATLDTRIERARAKSRAVVMALRYRDSPTLQTHWQAALTIGCKDYADFNNARSLVVAPTFSYRLGSGIDLLGQLAYRKNQSTLAQATGVESERAIYAGLVFRFDQTFNEWVGARSDILNVEHNMLNNGPVWGGE